MYANGWLDDFVANVRKICKQRGISITTLENDLQFSPGLISRWSKTKTSPGFDKILAIKSYLGVSFDELLEGTESSSGTDTNKIFDINSDTLLCKSIANQTKEGLLNWETPDDEIAESLSMDSIFQQWYYYDVHKLFFVKYRTGFIFLSVQFDTQSAGKNIVFYLLPEKGMELTKLQEDGGFATKTLSYIDNELYRMICDKAKEEFKNNIRNGGFGREVGS